MYLFLIHFLLRILHGLDSMFCNITKFTLYHMCLLSPWSYCSKLLSLDWMPQYELKTNPVEVTPQSNTLIWWTFIIPIYHWKKHVINRLNSFPKVLVLAKPSIKSIYLYCQTMSIDSNDNVHPNTRTKHFLFCPWAEVMVPEVFLIDQENHSGITKPTFLQDTN